MAGRGAPPTSTDAALDRHPLAVRVGLLIAAALIVLDQATKELAERVLTPGRFVPLLGDGVGWQLIYNPGGAFGLPAPSWLFLGVTVIVTVIVIRTLPRAPTLLQASAYGLLLAGAIGNVLDRLFRAGDPDGWAFGSGYVVDFVAWGSFPRFNVADSAITVGFVLLLGALWQEERRVGAEDEADGAAGSDGRGGSAGPDGSAGRSGADGPDGSVGPDDAAAR